MNTIEGLKKLPIIIDQLLSQRDSVQSQIDACYKPFRELIKEVILVNDGTCATYISNIFDLNSQNIKFTIKYKDDNEIQGTYKYPIDAFVSATTLREYIANEKYRLEVEAIKKNLEVIKANEQKDAERERAEYERLKKKFEGT